MPNTKIFWVKYLYHKANFRYGPFWKADKYYPGKFTKDDKFDNFWKNSRNNWKWDYKIVRCASENDIRDILFDYEHKRQGFKCFINILRCVEIKFNDLKINNILVEVNYNIVITKKNKKNTTKHGINSKFMMWLYWKTHSLGHASMVDKEIIAFNLTDDPSEYNNANALLKKLPRAPEGTKIEIKNFYIKYPY